MPLFRSRPQPEVPPAPIGAAVAAPVTGPYTCDRSGCGVATATGCAYVDRRGRRCATAWCTQHQEIIDGGLYCARHASTMRALGPEATSSPILPDLDNRVPGLVEWVSSDLEGGITDLLGSLTDTARGQELKRDRVTLVTGGGRTTERRWERSWKIVDHTGILRRVTVQVAEADPVTVAVRVDQRLLASGIPPWIQHRLRGENPSTTDDATERGEYYRIMYGVVAGELKSTS